MSDAAGIRVRVVYPFHRDSDDESWLALVASRYDGELSDRLMQSSPPQRDVWFENLSDADRFVSELTETQRWRAGRR